jgi:hypothetical protein
MQPALMLVTAATLGWSAPSEIRSVEPNDLLAAAFVARLSFDAQRPIETVSPEAVALHLWYPPVPATRALDVAGPSLVNPRRDIRYDLSLPFFRTKP